MLFDSYENKPFEEKIALFDFRMDNTNYNLSIITFVWSNDGYWRDDEWLVADLWREDYSETEERNGKDRQIDRGRES